MRRKLAFIIMVLFFSVVHSYAVMNITNVSPTNRQMNIPVNSSITIYFDQDISAGTAVSGNINIINSAKVFVPASISVSDNMVTLTPLVDLFPNEFHVVTISTNLRSTTSDSLAGEEKSYFYSGPGIETPHNLGNVDYASDTGWDPLNYISYDYIYTEIAASDSDDTLPLNWALTNFWISWNETNTFYRICIDADGNHGNAGDFYTLFFIDTTRDDQGATNFDVPAFAGLSGPGISFDDYRYPEIIYLQFHLNWSQWPDDSIGLRVVYYWDGNSWNNSSMAANVGFYNLGVNPEGLILNFKNFIFTNGSITGPKPNRISVLAMNATDSDTDTCSESGEWITYDFDNDGDDVEDGASVVQPPLLVVLTDPVNTEKSIGLNSVITVTFNSNINSSTVNNTNFVVYDDGFSEVPGVLAVSGNQITFTVTGSYLPTTTYSVILGQTIKNTSGGSLAAPYAFSFDTLYQGPFYVDAQAGSDGNLGTAALPLKSLEKVLSLMNNETINTAFCRGIFEDSAAPINIINKTGSSSSPFVLRNWDSTPVIKRGNSDSGVVINYCTNLIVQGFDLTEIQGFAERVFAINNSKFITLLSNNHYESSIKTGKIMTIDHSYYVTVDRCFFSSMSSGFIFDESSFSNFSLINSSVSNIGTGSTRLFDFAVALKNIVISNTLIHSCKAYIMYTGTGVMNNMKVADCSFYNNTIPTYMFYFRYTTDNFFFENNQIYNNTGNTWALWIVNPVNNFSLKNNYIEANGTVMYTSDPISGLIMKNNFFKGGSENCIYLYDYVSEVSVISNFFYVENGYGLRINNADTDFLEGATQDERAIHNNVFILNGSVAGFGIRLYGSTTQDFIIRNNTFIGDISCGIEIGTGGDISVRNNIIYDNVGALGSYGVMQYGGVITADYNDLYNITDDFWSVTTEGANNLSLDPQFINETLTDWIEDDFVRTLITSPCLDTGDPVDDSDPQVYGAHIDIGAFENTNVPSFSLIRSVQSVNFSGPNGNKKIPGATGLVAINYDNDSSTPGDSLIIRIKISSNISYVSNSASQNNDFHTGVGASYVVEVFDGSLWVLDNSVYNPENISAVQWKFSLPIGAQDNSEGTDTVGIVDGAFPDLDAGIVRYKFVIK